MIPQSQYISEQSEISSKIYKNIYKSIYDEGSDDDDDENLTKIKANKGRISEQQLERNLHSNILRMIIRMDHYWNNKNFGDGKKSQNMQIMLLMMGFQYITNNKTKFVLRPYDLETNFSKCINKL